MRPVLRSVLVLLGVAAVAACASGPDVPVGAARDRTTRVDSRGGASEVRAIAEERRVDGLILAPPDSVWVRLPGVFETLGVEVTYSDPRARIMGNRGFRVRRIEGKRPAEWVDCGSGPTARPYANEYEVTMGLTVQLVPVEEGTQARVRVEASAKPREFSGQAVACTSDGSLERRILTLAQP